MKSIKQIHEETKSLMFCKFGGEGGGVCLSAFWDEVSSLEW